MPARGGRAYSATIGPVLYQCPVSLRPGGRARPIERAGREPPRMTGQGDQQLASFYYSLVPSHGRPSAVLSATR